jgi:transposase
VLESLKPWETALYLDEVDIHLNPKIGLDWMNRGQQKFVLTPGNNVKRYVCGAEDARSSELTWVLADRKNSLLFIQALRQLLRRYPDKRIIHVVLDNFSIHNSRQTREWLAEQGKRIRLHFLPPYCPQHNRIERLWLDLHASVTRNHTCRTIEELIERVVQFLVDRNRIARRKAA